MRKTVDLALQGGGAHGALTWGVLDGLLEDGRLDFCGVSGTSAGAMNAVVLAAGLEKGGSEGARAALEAFWRAVSDAARFSPIQRGIWERLSGSFSLERSPAFMFFESLTRVFSPAQLNVLDLNPLRDLVARTVDFDAVNRCGVRVFVAATNVRSGRLRVFSQPELTADTVMASACLPFLFRAVEIGGEAYWDGGYMGNPALHPLVDDTPCRDLVIVQINPVIRRTLPRSAREIADRVNEITFNASLVKELRTIHLLRRLIEAEGLDRERYRDMRVHLIHMDEAVQELEASSKLNAEWEYLSRLRDIGREEAARWLGANFDSIGERPTIDLQDFFADSLRPVPRN